MIWSRRNEDFWHFHRKKDVADDEVDGQLRAMIPILHVHLFT